MLISPSPTTHFYTQMRAVDELRADLGDLIYQEVPDDWDMLMIEVARSLDAVERGMYKEVNALAAAAIITIQNSMRKLLPGVELPFIFTGDGATILAPRCIREALTRELSRLVGRAQEGFGLELKVGLIPVYALLKRGEPVLVGKHRLSPSANMALFSGSGYTLAHALFHQRHEEVITMAGAQGAPDLEGFECRWHPVPAKRGQIVSLMVKAIEPELQRTIYAAILSEIEEITDTDTHPLQIDQLRLSTTPQDLYVEATLRAEVVHRARIWLYQRVALIINLIGIFLLRMGWRASDFNGATYLSEVLDNTDYRRFDDTLRITLDLDAAQLDALRALLRRQHEAHRIVYGLHCSQSAQITCMIESHAQRHLHFVDGANGGFVLAALEMNTQLEALRRVYNTELREAS